MKNPNIDEISRRVANKYFLTKVDVRRHLMLALDEIVLACEMGEIVNLTKFGKFQFRKKNHRCWKGERKVLAYRPATRVKGGEWSLDRWHKKIEKGI